MKNNISEPAVFTSCGDTRLCHTQGPGATYGLGQGGAGGAYKPAADEDPSVVSIGLNFTF